MSTHPAAGIEGFEDEDMELQAALQASLMGSGGLAEDFVLPPSTARSIPSGSGPRTGPGGINIRTPTLPPMASVPPLGFPPPVRSQAQYDPADPVAASMARNRLIMERARREQEMALQEQYEEEAERVANANASPATRTRTRRGEEEEEEMLRQAIRESQLLAGEGTQQASSTVITNPHAPLMVDDEDDEDADFVDAEMDVDDDDEEYHPPFRPAVPPTVLPAPTPLSNAELGPMQPLSYPNHRVYDDDDAELQAALKASLENVPEGFTIPPEPRPAAPSSSVPVQSAATSLSNRRSIDDELASEADTTSMEASQPEEQSVSVDEMRRRRLARFGG
jgi:Ataxin-3